MERFLSEEEIARLAVALTTESSRTENPYPAAAIRLLLLTGGRRGEILGLQWQHVDIEQRCLRLPDSKTGAKVVYLNPPALEALVRLPRVEGNPYVQASQFLPIGTGLALDSVQQIYRPLSVERSAVQELWRLPNASSRLPRVPLLHAPGQSGQSPRKVFSLASWACAKSRIRSARASSRFRSSLPVMIPMSWWDAARFGVGR
jgi:integrase